VLPRANLQLKAGLLRANTCSDESDRLLPWFGFVWGILDLDVDDWEDERQG
jgi:hypothetical protein